MSNVVSFSIESQTGKEEIVSICHLNIKSLSLELSDIAKILFNKNIEMFNRINNGTKITSMRLVRHIVTKQKPSTNRLSTRVINSFESVDQEIASLGFDNGALKPKFRYQWPSGKTADISLESIINGSKKNILDVDKPTFDDLASAELVCTSKEIRLFQNIGIKTFMFKDNLANKENIVEVAYSLEINTKSVFKDYITNNIKKLKNSINFIRKQLNKIEIGKLYNYESENFNPTFLKSSFNEMGIEYPFLRLDTEANKENLNNSVFGTAAKNLYNSKLLLSNTINTNLYDQTLLGLLPVKNSNPEKMMMILKDFESTLNELERVYLKKASSLNTRKKSSVSAKKAAYNTIIVRTKENYEYDNDELGYNIFSNNASMAEVTISQMKERVKSETRRYCNALDNPGSLSNLVGKERTNFVNKDSTFGFLTPIGLRHGKDVIDTSRGIFAISPEDVNVFRMKKAIKASTKKSSRYSKSTPQNKIGSSAASSFNLSVGTPVKSALQLKREGEVNPYIDAREFFGDSSTFIINEQFAKGVEFKKRLKKINKTNRKVLSRMVPRAFLTRKNKINSTKQVSINNRDSKINKAIVNKSVDVRAIPPQIRSLSLQPPPKPNQSDPIKNFKSAGIIEETQMNTFKVSSLTGFDRDETGFFNMNAPKYELLNLNTLDSDRPLLVFADNYEIPELGLLKDKSPATIYNRLLYIKGRRRNG